MGRRYESCVKKLKRQKRVRNPYAICSRLRAKATKKDFLMIGKTLRDLRADKKTVDSYVDSFKLSNPLFDEKRFRQFVKTGIDVIPKRK